MRAYVRTDNWSINAAISKTETSKKWEEVEVTEMSAGGLTFNSSTQFSVGDTIWFDLHINPMIAGMPYEFDAKVKGKIKSDRGQVGGSHEYGVEFQEIPYSTRVRLDELVRLTISKYKLDASSGESLIISTRGTNA